MYSTCRKCVHEAEGHSMNIRSTGTMLCLEALCYACGSILYNVEHMYL